MVILAGTVRITPGQRDAALNLIEAMVEATRAEEGCIDYAFAFDVPDDPLVRIFEVFRDEAALAAHRASSHMASWRESWPNVSTGERNMHHYDVSAAYPL